MQIPFAVGSGKLVHSWQRWRACFHPLMPSILSCAEDFSKCSAYKLQQ